MKVVTHQLQVDLRTGKFVGQRPTFYHCAMQPMYTQRFDEECKSSNIRDVDVLPCNQDTTAAYRYSRDFGVRLFQWAEPKLVQSRRSLLSWCMTSYGSCVGTASLVAVVALMWQGTI